MGLLLISSFLWWIAMAAASSALDRDNPTFPTSGTEPLRNAVAGALILELEDGQDMDQVIKAVQRRGWELRRKIDSGIFRGISVQRQDKGWRQTEMQDMAGIKTVWPLRMGGTAKLMAEGGTVEKAEQQKSHGHSRRSGNEDSTTYDRLSHSMTQVNKLHKEGFTGNGIKIAIIDTGVDYKHPALGGCFGEGCRVAKGDNFAKDRDSHDPMDCNGHSTGVAGILAGHDNEAGYIGAAPNATLYVYRVLDCRGEGAEDDMMQGWIKALANVASRIVDSGVTCIMGIGNELDKGPFYTRSPSSGRGVISVTSLTDYGLSSLSASGQTWDLDIKPDIGAPGDGIVTTGVGGSYTSQSGTSFSGPLVAGAVALIAEARNTFDPTLIRALLTSYAIPQKDTPSLDLMVIPQQGGGLLRAWDAAHAKTIVQSAGLIFNDTEHRPASLGLSIKNTASFAVTYQLSNIPAMTLYTLGESSIYPQDNYHWLRDRISKPAGITISTNSVTLPPGKSIVVHISASDPEGLNPDRLPVWSGWIAVNGSDGSSLTVPYQGLAGSLRKATVIDANAKPLVSFKDGRDFMNSFHIYNISGHAYEPLNTVTLFELNKQLRSRLEFHPSPAFAVFHPALGSPQVRIDIVPQDFCPSPLPKDHEPSPAPSHTNRLCAPESLITSEFKGANTKTGGLPVEKGPYKSIGQVPGYPAHHVGRGDITVEWDGSVSSGKVQFAPPGKYKLVARFLDIFGDAENSLDWTYIESPAFVIAYDIWDDKNGELFIPEIWT